MKPPSSASVPVITLCALAAGLTGQHLAQTEAAASLPLTPATVSPIRTGAPNALGQPSGTWASGPNYKVSFHDGMVFYPLVGADLPHQPLRWRTTSVHAGATELLAAGRAASAPRFDDHRCEYDLGLVTERYDVRLDGLEQSFVIHQRPPAGDLVIVGEVTTPLHLAANEPQHGPLALTLADGRAVLSYGAAVVVDADGTTTPITTASDGNRIVLRVAAETVAAASFPLVVDPLISNTVTAIAGTTDDIDVLTETLTDPALNARRWIAFSYAFAAGDNDIRLWRYADDFTGAQEVYREITTWNATHGRLGLAPAVDYIVMAYAIATGGDSWVSVHRHHKTDFGLATNAVFVPQTSVDFGDWRPDVGGRLEPTGSKVLITFQREDAATFANTDTSTVYACVYDPSISPATSGFVVQPFVVLSRPNADQERPVVNQSASTNNWLVAFQEMNGAVQNDDWDITTVAVDANGTVTETGLAVAQAGGTEHKVTPEIAGAFGRYELTYGTRAFELPNPKPLGTGAQRIYGQRLDWNHVSGTGSLPHQGVQLHSVATNSLKNGGIAFDSISKSHWCASVANDLAATYRAFKLGFTGNVVEFAPIPLAANRTPHAIAATFSVGSRSFPIVFSEEAGPGASLHYGTEMQYDQVLPPTLINFACGSGVWGGLAATADRQQIGSQAMPLLLTNAPQNTVALLIVSTALGNVPGGLIGAPGCTLVPDIVSTAYVGMVTANISGGEATVALDLPEFLTPMNVVLQWAYLVPGANALNLLASEGLRVQVGR
jgi:hypothetical protein